MKRILVLLFSLMAIVSIAQPGVNRPLKGWGILEFTQNPNLGGYVATSSLISYDNGSQKIYVWNPFDNKWDDYLKTVNDSLVANNSRIIPLKMYDLPDSLLTISLDPNLSDAENFAQAKDLREVFIKYNGNGTSNDPQFIWLVDKNQEVFEFKGTSVEIDPFFNASPAYSISSQNITDWNAAFGWGDHRSEGYLKIESDPVFSSSPASTITNTDKTNWNTSYSWGNHANEGYLKEEDQFIDTLRLVGDNLQISISDDKKPFSVLPLPLTKSLSQNQISQSTRRIFILPEGTFIDLNVDDSDAATNNEGILGISTTGLPDNQFRLTSNTQGSNGIIFNAPSGISYSVTPGANGASVSITNTLPENTKVADTPTLDLTLAGNGTISGNVDTSIVATRSFVIDAIDEATITETDPVFGASPAAGVTNGNISNWNTAYGWGNHEVEGYLKTETDPVFGASPAATITNTNKTNWTQAYNWGNHATQGYLISEIDGSTTNEIQTIDTFQIVSGKLRISLDKDGQATKEVTLPSGADGWGTDVVISDNTLSGNGTSSNVLKVDTTIIATVALVNQIVADGGITDHGLLSGLADDDHPQYLNEGRGDARYYTKTQLDGGQLDTRYYTEGETNTLLGGKANTSHTHAISDVVNLQTTLDGKAPTVHTHTISQVTGLQTALDGKSNTGHGHTIGDVTGLQTALDGKQPIGDYANAIHTHVISQITGLQAALDSKSNIGHTHGISDVTGLQTALDGKAATVHTHTVSQVVGLQDSLNSRSKLGHTHSISQVNGLQAELDGKAATVHGHTITDVSGLQTALDGKAPTSHTHTISQVTGLQTALDGKQPVGDYASSVHTHTISQVTGLQTALDGKSNTGHGHSISDVTNLQTTLDGKAPISHNHTISQVTGLQTALDGKQPVGSYANATHTHIIGDVTGLQTALDGKASTTHGHAISDVTGLQTILNTIPTNIQDLGNVTITSPTNDQVLTFEAGLWVNKAASGGGGGGASGPMNQVQAIGSTPTVLSVAATPTVLASITITPQLTTSPILVSSQVNATKDATTTRRSLFTFIRRSPSTQIGQLCDQLGPNVASASFAPQDNSGIDISGTTSPITYELCAYGNVASIVTAQNWTLQAIELVGARGEQGPIGPAGSVDEIIAGTGISVDNTNPDRPIVSAIAGAGLTNWSENKGTFSSQVWTSLIPNDPAANVNAIIGPKGTGYISARVPTGNATGGNQRGTNAVDFQTNSTNASRVASGINSTISGGTENTASGERSVVSGGGINTASNFGSTVSGGSINQATGNCSTVSGGTSNTAASFGEWVGGVNLTTIAPNSANVYNISDRLFGIGNGTSSPVRSSALNIFKGGVGAAKTYINPGSDTAVPTADVQIGGTTGIVIPRGTTAQRNATPTQGEMRFNTTTSKFEGWTGTAWVDFH